MSLERLQCPSCGGSLVSEGRDTLFCSYCGAKLRIKTGASGHPMAALDGIKEDTGLLAKRAAYDHVQEESRELRAQSEQWRQARAKLKEADKQSGPGCLVLVGLVTLVGGAILVWSAAASLLANGFDGQRGLGNLGLAAIGVALIGVPVLAAITSTREANKKSAQLEATRAELKAKIIKANETIVVLEQRATDLKAELDRAIGNA